MNSGFTGRDRFCTMSKEFENSDLGCGNFSTENSFKFRGYFRAISYIFARLPLGGRILYRPNEIILKNTD